ncbi:MAG: glycosyltransferase family 4 protein [Kiritimatiellae bacterium]|nr:glycosyltransferase family 4 protein [Kiritimatiellia bacterium]
MRILFLSHYFHPEGNAPATRVYEMTRRWVKARHEVTVVTGVPNVPNGIVYPGYRNRPIQRETIEGVNVVRVWTHIAPNKGTVRRILNYLSFMASACCVGLRVRRPDVLIATSPQFFCGWAGAIVSRLRRLPFVLEIRDIWPESIVAVGALTSKRLIRMLEWLERRLYRAATHIVTVGEGYKAQLEQRGVGAERISVIPNGVDRAVFHPINADVSSTSARANARAEIDKDYDKDYDKEIDVRKQYGLRGKFVVAYIGTIGMACGLEVVLRAARRLKEKGREDIRFLLVGDGAVRARLETEAKERGLDNVGFTGRVDKKEVPDYLAATDACLVHLKKTPLFQTVLPSKIFEAAAMGKPIILGVEGEAAKLVEEAAAGVTIEPDNDERLVVAIERLAGDGELRARLGAAGREHIAARYDYDGLASAYVEVLEEVARGNAGR